MKKLLLSVFLWLVAIPAIAQRSPSTTRPDSLSVVQAAPDTVAAIHRLFAAERRIHYIVSGFFGALSIGATVAYAVPGNKLQDNASYLLVAVLGIPSSLGVLVTGQQYSRQRERQAIEAFTKHQLPSAIKQKLRPYYFVHAVP